MGAPPVVGLEGGVQAGGGVVHRLAHQKLQGLASPSGVDELHLEALLGEVPAPLGHLVGDDANKLGAEGQAQLLPAPLPQSHAP